MNCCENYLEQISALVDDELNEQEEAEIKAHLDQCPDCAALYETLISVSNAASKNIEFPEGLHSRIMEKINEMAEEEKKPSENSLENNPYFVARKAQGEAMKNKTYRIARTCVYGAACLILCGFAIASSVGHRGDVVMGAKTMATAESATDRSFASEYSVAAAAPAYESTESEEAYAVNSEFAVMADAANSVPEVSLDIDGVTTCYLLSEEENEEIFSLLNNKAEEKASVSAEAKLEDVQYKGSYTDADGNIILLYCNDESSMIMCESDGVTWVSSCSLGELIEMIK